MSPKAKSAKIRTAIKEVLSNSSFKQQASRLQQIVIADAQLTMATDELESLAGTSIDQKDADSSSSDDFLLPQKIA